MKMRTTIYEAYKALVFDREHNNYTTNLLEIRLSKPIYLKLTSMKELESNQELELQSLKDPKQYWELIHLYKRVVVTFQAYEEQYKNFTDNDFEFRILRPIKFKEGKRTYSRVKLRWKNVNEKCVIYARLF